MQSAHFASRAHASLKRRQRHAGPIELRNPGLLMDVKVKKGGKFQHAFPSSWNCFAYVFDGSGSIGGSPAQLQTAVVLEPGDFVEASTDDAKVRVSVITLLHRPARHCIICISHPSKLQLYHVLHYVECRPACKLASMTLC